MLVVDRSSGWRGALNGGSTKEPVPQPPLLSQDSILERSDFSNVTIRTEPMASHSLG